MKKFTLLFVILLAMFSDAFGQKEGKVLWENLVDSTFSQIGTGYYPQPTADNSLGLKIKESPLGKILIEYIFDAYSFYGIRGNGLLTYNYDGKLVWEKREINALTGGGQLNYILPSTVNRKNYTLAVSSNHRGNGVYRPTGINFFDKEFNTVKQFSGDPTTVTGAINFKHTIAVDDGVFHNNLFEKAIIKYNESGEEKWRYGIVEPLSVLSSKAPYFLTNLNTTNKRQVLIFDDNGKKIGETEPQSFTQLFTSNDKGFWLKNNEFEYKKFDSTGRQSANYLYKDGFYDNILPTVLADNSILLSFVSNNEVLLTKITPSGEISKYSISANIKFKDYYNTFIYKYLASENKIMYSLRLQDTEQAEADIKYKIGVVDFDNTANSWSKDIHGGASNGINGNAFTFEANNTFFQIYSKPDNPPIKIFKVYDITGNLKWESPFVINNPQGMASRWLIDKEFLYVGAIGFTNGDKDGFLKVRYTDGKVIWKKEQVSFDSFLKDIQKNKNGDEFILYGKNNVYKIVSLNAEGSEKWAYTVRTTSQFPYTSNIIFSPTDNGQLIVMSQELKDNKPQLILRKIALCSALNTISITANTTEACPTEKVKLSAVKQDGISYQWQKDGKDLPNYKDVVYDFGESGTYTLVAQDKACQNTVTSNAIKVNIRSLPTTEITTPKSTFCEGEKTTIASKTNGTFFQWTKDGKDIPNATSGIYEASQVGEYRVGVRDDKCPQVGYSNIISINIKPSPEATISTDIKGVIYEPFKVKLNANVGAGLSYQWFKNDTLLANATTAVYEADKSGTYQVKVSKDGCVRLSEPFKISILIPLATESEVGEDDILVYPNPSKGTFQIVLPTSLKNADVRLYDSYGREHYFEYGNGQAQIRSLLQGVYFLRVSKNERSVSSKIIIE